MPRGMRGNAAGEKAKDFKGTIKKLIKYMNAFKFNMLFVAVFESAELFSISLDQRYSVKQRQRSLTDW